MEEAPKKKRGRPVGWRKHKPVESDDLFQQALQKTKDQFEAMSNEELFEKANKYIPKTPDIVKCPGTGCPKKESCLRYTTPAKEKNQAFFTMEVSIKDVIKCQFYWEVN